MSIDLGRDNPVEVQWCDLERASHKPKWLRFFIPGKTITSIRFSDILLYDFKLTPRGALRKKSRKNQCNASILPAHVRATEGFFLHIA